MTNRSEYRYGNGSRSSGRGDELVLDPANPMAIARTMIAREFTAFGHLTLRHHRGEFYQWEKGHYRPKADLAISNLLYAFLEKAKRVVPHNGIADFKPTRKSVGDVFDALKAISYINDDLVPPVWLSEFNRHPASEFVVTQSGLLHVPTRKLLRQLFPARPESPTRRLRSAWAHRRSRSFVGAG